MSGPLTYDEAMAPTAQAGLTFEEAMGHPSGSGFLRQLADLPIGVVKGALDLPNAGIGLADIATGGKAGDLIDSLGDYADRLHVPKYLRPTQWADEMGALYSPEMTTAKGAAHQAAVDAAEQAKGEGDGAIGQELSGFGGYLKGAMENPRAAMALVTENLAGQKAIGMAAAKMLKPALPAIRAAVESAGPVGSVERTAAQAAADARIADLAGKYGAIGEGVLSSGQNAQQLRHEQPNSSALDYLLQIPAGAITGAISRGVGKIPGLEDAEQAMALNQLGQKGKLTGGPLSRFGKGVLSEGVLQELPQSIQEQAWQNLAEGKPWYEGAGEQGAQGLLAGGAMGGGAGAMSSHARGNAPQDAPQNRDYTDASADEANAGLRAAMDQYQESVPGIPRLSLNPNATDGNVIQMPAPEGSLADAANTARKTGAARPAGSSLLAAYPTPQAAEAARTPRDDADFLDVVPHPENQAQFAVVPKSEQEIARIQGVQRARQAAQYHQEQLSGEENAAQQDASANKRVADLHREAASVEKSIVPGVTPEQDAEIARAHASDLRAQADDLSKKAAAIRQHRVTDSAQAATAVLEQRGRQVLDLARQANEAAAAGETAASARLKARANEMLSNLRADRQRQALQTSNDQAQHELAPAKAQPVASMPGEQKAALKKAYSALGSAETRTEQLADEEQPVAVDAASRAANTAPTEAQKEAGNYRKGHIKVGGLRISVENPVGSKRGGIGNGKPWSVNMTAHYGYVTRTVGADREQVDVYVKPGTKENHQGPVFVVDQYDPDTGRFDEHKTLVGYGSAAEASKAYDAHFADQSGPKRRGAVTRMTSEGFKQWLDNGDTTKPVGAKKFGAAPTVSPQSSSSLVSQKPERKISDFGEKIGGARKDTAPSLSKDISDEEIAREPLSKLWPADEIDKIEDKFAAAVAYAARSAIPSKPRMERKLRQWVEVVKLMRSIPKILSSGDVTPQRFYELVDGRYELRDVVSRIKLLNLIDRGAWSRIGNVSEAPNAFLYEGDKQVPAPMVRVQVDEKNHWLRGSGNVADHVPAIEAMLGGPRSEQRMKFEIRRSSGENPYFINKKGDGERRPLKTFRSADEARSFLSDHYADLVAAWEAVKASDNVHEKDVRGETNRPRSGEDYRAGKDVSPEQFGETFGFRGVQFGNWVRQGVGAKERQGALNQSYDALMDLARIVGVPTRAISLNGTLGLSFGARGSGWASAHFEPDNLVINLTKTRGAGALAHEWFHALDNYFQSHRGKGTDYITKQPENYYLHKGGRTRLPERAFEVMIEGGSYPGYGRINPSARNRAEWTKVDGVRTEVAAAFADLVKALNDSPMAARSELIDKGKSGDYWSSIIERAARSFENYVLSKMMERGFHNDYLANVTSVEDFPRSKARYPYLLPEEVAPISEAFDHLFSTIQIAQSGGRQSRARSESPAAETPEQRHARMAAEANARKTERALPTLPTRQGDMDEINKRLGVTDAVVVIPRELGSQAGPHNISKQAADFIAQVARMFGKRVVYFSTEQKEVDGFWHLGNTIYLNSTSSIAQLRVLGHELTHDMRSRAPAAYQSMLAAVQNLLTDEELRRYHQDYYRTEFTGNLEDAHENGGTVRDFLAEEWLADLSGNRFAEGKFWRDVFQEIENRHGTPTAKGVISRLRLAFSNALNKILQATKGGKFAVDARMTVNRLDQIRAAVKKGFVEYERAVKTGDIQEEGESGVKLATAWHGTPHTWSPEPVFPHGRPRLDKMGTGQGEGTHNYVIWDQNTLDRVVLLERNGAKMGAIRASIARTGKTSFSPDLLSAEFQTALQDHFKLSTPQPVKLSNNTPASLQLFGWRDIPIVVTPNVIDKMHFDHGLTIQKMARLPYLLNRPLMIFADSKNKSLAMVGGHLEHGDISLVALKPEAATTVAEAPRANLIVTGYTPQNGWAEVTKRIARGELVYRDTSGAIPGVVRGALVAAQKRYAQFGRDLPRELLQGSEPRTYGDSSEKAQSGTRSPTVGTSRSVLGRGYIVLGQSDLVKHESAIWPEGAKFSLRRALGALTPDQEQAAGHVLGAPRTIVQRLQDFRADWKKNLVQGIFDQFSPIKELDQNAYIQARLSKGGDSTLEALMLYGKLTLGTDGATDVQYTKAGGMQGFASKLSKLNGEHDRFLLWVAAQRAERLKSVGLENLWSDQDIAALKTLDQGNQRDGAERAPLFRQALRDLNEYNDNVLEIAAKSGLIDDTTRQMYKDMPYVPFYRLQEDDKVSGFAVKAGLVNQYAWKKLKGGTAKLNEDLLANLLHNWSNLISASAKNRAAKSTLDAAVRAGVAARIPFGAPGKGHVSYREDGRDRTFLVSDPHLIDAVSALEYAGLGPWSKPLTTAKHWLTTGVTANPAFKIRNLIRDSIASAGIAQMSYNPAKNLGQGWGSTSLESETRAHMLASGGMIRFGSMLDGKSSDRAQALIRSGVNPEHILDSDSKIKNFWERYVHPALEAYQEFGDRTEQVNRAALYDQLVSKGLTHAEAAYWARDLMDFSMSGKWTAIRVITQTVPFFNARLQGMYKLGRATKEDYRRAAAVLGATAICSLALLLAYGDDDDWKKRTDEERNNYWWIKVGGYAFHIPKPFEIGAVATLAERGYELWANAEMTPKRFGKAVRDIVMSQLSMNPTPQLFKPMIDIYANKDSFTGNDIESAADQKLRKQYRYAEKTSLLARFLGSLGLPDPTQLTMGRWDTLSPKQVDFLAKAYFSWLGTMTTTALDYGIRPMLNLGDRPDMQLKDAFFLGNFVESLPSNNSRYLSQMYVQAKEIEQAYNSYHARLKLGDTVGSQEIREQELQNILRYHPTEQLKRMESLINVRLRRIEADQNMTGAEKRARMDDLYQQKNQIALQFRAQ